jgi:hypothetical protein
VKHQRAFRISENTKETHYLKANLGNVLNALSALYILEMAYMFSISSEDDRDKFEDYSRLFKKKLYGDELASGDYGTVD